MGIGGTETKPKVPPLTAGDLKTLLEISQKRCQLYRNKKVNNIKNLKQEVINCIKQNNYDLASAKMQNLMKDEDLLTVYDILNPLFEIIKEKTIYIISSNECPPDLRAPLDTVIYAATRLEVEELSKFREKIIQKYGSAYIAKADNNADKLVNQNLAAKLGVTVFPTQMVNIRIQQLTKGQFKPPGLIPDVDSVIPADIDRNPYESMRPNLPTQSTIDKSNNNTGPYPSFNPQPPSQGGFPQNDFPQNGFPQNNFPQNSFPQNSFNDGFPRQDPSQGGFPSNTGQSQFPNDWSGMPTKSQIEKSSGGMGNQSSFPQANPYEDNNNNNDFSNMNQQQNNFGETLVTGTVPISEKSSRLEQSQQTNSQIKPQTNNFNNIGQNNSAIPPYMNKIDGLGGETGKVGNFSANITNPQQKLDANNINILDQKTSKSNVSLGNSENKDNPFIPKTDPLLIDTLPVKEVPIKPGDNKGSIQKGSQINDPLLIKTLQVEEEPIKPGEGVNPYEPGVQLQDPLGGKTLPEEEIPIKSGEGVNPYAPGVQLKDPLGGTTLPIEEQPIQSGEGVNPYAPGVQLKDPLGGTTLPIEEQSIKSGEGVNPYASGAQLKDPLGGNTLSIKEQPIKPPESVNPFASNNNNIADPLGGKTAEEVSLSNIKSVNPFEGQLNDPLGGETLPEEGKLKQSGGVGPNSKIFNSLDDKTA